MKAVISLVVLLMFPVLSFAQNAVGKHMEVPRIDPDLDTTREIAKGETKDDYDQYAMTRFVKFYNTKQIDSIYSLFIKDYFQVSKHLPERTNSIHKQSLDSMYKEYGLIKSCVFFRSADVDYEGGGAYFIYFYVTFLNSTELIRLTLDKKNKIESFCLGCENDASKTVKFLAK